MKKSNKKKKSPREIIEAEDDPNEHAWVKFPGKELYDITKGSTHESVTIDMDKLRGEKKKHRQKKYTHIHTHLEDSEEASFSKYRGRLSKEVIRNYGDARIIPSGPDLGYLIEHNDCKAIAIAQKRIDDGKISGYLIIRKTKRTPKFKAASYSTGLKNLFARVPEPFEDEKLKDLLNHYSEALHKAISHRDYKGALRELEEVAEHYHLKLKYLPAEHHKLNHLRTKFIKKDLEGRVAAIIATLSLITSIIVMSPNLTGFVVSELNNKTANWIGIILFFVGLAGIIFYFKRSRSLLILN